MSNKNKAGQNGAHDEKEKKACELIEGEELGPPTAPDGGWGWAVMIASFFCNLIVDGVCYTFGIFFTELVDYFGSTKSETALVGALVPGMYLIVGPIVSALANKFGCRIVTIVGSLIAAIFFVVSSFSTSINMMMATYGVLGGVGFGLMYLPSIVMVGYYFDKKRAFATGIAVCGSGIGTFVFAPLGSYLVEEYGWKGANIIIGAIILNGVVFGAIFRPLEPKRRPLVIRTSTIMNKIVDEKRQRTYSVDDTTITEDNKVIRSTDASEGKGQGQLVIMTSGQSRVKTDTYNSSASLSSQKRAQFLDVEGHGPMSMTASQRSLNEKKKALASPFARQDALYTGSIQNLKEYKNAGGEMNTYVSSVMNLPQDDPADENSSCMSSAVRILKQMFDFSLLRSPTFILICGAGVLCFLGLYTPFVYVTEKAKRQLGVESSRASLILSVLGACNTVSRVLTGLVADSPRVDCLLVHNIAAVIAGGVTCLVAVFNSYELLMLYAALFGVSIAAFIALRSIVMVELLGLEKLTNAFGLSSLFQGIAVLIGSPMSGAIQEATDSYVGPFLVSGSLIALGGIICLPVRRVARWEMERDRRKAMSKGNYSKVNTNA